jgi:hypothetical protein
MTKDQLIQIAKAGFPDNAKRLINFENSEMIFWGDVYRLYDKDCPFIMMLPKEEYLSIFINDDGFVQIQVINRAFNHFAAIKEMLSLGLIEL